MSWKLKKIVLSVAVGLSGPSMLSLASAASAYDLGTNTLVWSQQMLPGSATGGKLSNVVVTSSPSANILNAGSQLQSAVAAYAADTTDGNRTALADATETYRSTVAAANGNGTAGTLRFDSTYSLSATANTADQRLSTNGHVVVDTGIAGTLTISNNRSSERGGAVEVNGGGYWTQTGNGSVTFSGNTVTSANNQPGGAVYNDGTLSFSGPVTFSDNVSESGDGSSIYSWGKSYFLGTATFTDNISSGGSAYYNASGTVYFGGNAVFDHNTARNQGGAIYSRGTTLFTGDTVFSNNEAVNSDGGAIYNTDSDAAMTFAGAASFSNNQALNYGGALSNKNGGNVTFLGETLFSGNDVTSGLSAYGYGGGVYNQGATVSFSGHTVFSKNTASNKGGGLYSNDGVVNLTPDTGNTIVFTGNTAGGEANSVYLEGKNTLNLGGGGDIDMRDAMGGDALDAAISIAKTGKGTWYLGGQSLLAGKTEVSVSDGELHLYRAGEKDNGTGFVEKGSLKLTGSDSVFKLGAGAELSVGGADHTVTAGSILFEAGSTLSFDAKYHDADTEKAMLTLDGAVSAGGALNINLNSLYAVDGSYDGSYVVAQAVPAYDFAAAVGAGTLTYYDVDYKHDDVENTRAKGRIKATGTADGKIIIDQKPVGNIVLDWTGKEGETWSYTQSSWLNEAGNDTKFWDGDYVRMNGAGEGGVAINKKGVIVAGMEITGGNYTFTGGTVSSAAANETTLAKDDPAHYTQQLTVDNAAVTLANAGLSFAKGITFGPGADITVGADGTSATDYGITGNVTFEAGSTLNLDFVGTGNDKLTVDGAVTVNGGTVNLVAGAGTWSAGTAYTLIDTTAGVTGTFDNLSENFAFLTPALLYADDRVSVVFTEKGGSNKFEDAGGTFNQRHTGAGVDSLSSGHPVYRAVISMSADQARTAYDYLSGEIYGSTRSALLTNSRYLRDAVNHRMLAHDLKASESPLWLSSWGHREKTDGDGNAASASNTGFGFAIGADRMLTDNVLGGLVFGYERTKTEAKARRSENTTDAFHFGTYAATDVRTVKLRGGLVYSYLDGKTEREIPIGGLEGTATGKSHGWQAQAFAEASKDFQVSDTAVLSPYAHVAHVWLNTGRVRESGSLAALSVAKQTDNVTFTTLGMRGEVKLPVQKASLSLYGDLGWQHVFGDVDGQTTNRFLDAGNPFAIRGVGVDKNSGLVGLGLKAEINAKNTVTAGYQGVFGSHSRDHAATVQWKMRF